MGYFFFTVTDFNRKVTTISGLLIFSAILVILTTKSNAQVVWNNDSYVHRKNNQILDGQNNIIRLEGVNLGGWLMWEGWIWGGGFTSEKEITNQLQNIAGEPAATAFKDSVYRNYITRADFQKIAEECFNVVRIPFNHNLLEDDAKPYKYKPEGWAILDSVLKWCEDYHVYAVLDLHSAPGGQSSSFTADPDFLINLWNGSINQKRTIKLWKAIAERYKDRGIIAGYDILNEPNVSDPNDLLSLYKAITDTIRLVDKNHLIMLEGNNYATDFSLFSSLPDPNICFQFHFYTWFFSSDKNSRLRQFTNLSEELNVPVWCGEWGENKLSELDTTLKLLNNPAYKISGNAFWTWKKVKKPGQQPYYYDINPTDEWNKTISWICDKNSPPPTESEFKTGTGDFIRNARIQNATCNTAISEMLRLCPSISIQNDHLFPKIKVYPNPFGNRILVYNPDKDNFYEIINATGRVLWRGRHIERNDFSNFKKGIYFLKMKNHCSSQIIKLIKQ